MFWLIAKSSTWFLPKFTRELALVHRGCQFGFLVLWSGDKCSTSCAVLNDAGWMRGAGEVSVKCRICQLGVTVLDLFPSVSGTSRNITTDNYFTSIPLAMELKSRKLTLVGTIQRNKACIPPSFLAKADEGTVQYAFDHANNFTLLSVAPKKNKRDGYLSTMRSGKKRETRIPEMKK